MQEEIKCFDKFNEPLNEGDYVDVQGCGLHKIYKGEYNQLYFRPYGKEELVFSYFSNDLIKFNIDAITTI